MNRRRIILLLLPLISCLAGLAAAAADDTPRLYRSKEMNIEFELPSGWTQWSCASPERGTACLELQRSDDLERPDPAIVITVREGNLDGAAGSHVLFEKRGNVWVKHGRYDEHEAVPIAGPNWNGLEASASCGISTTENGFMPAAGICYTAILSNGRRSVVIESDGFESTIDTFHTITKSVRFTQ